jgi:hypothetical protein
MGVLTKRNFLMSVGAAALLAPVTAPIAAYAQDDLMKKLINKPDAGAWGVYGAGQTNKKVRDKDVTGGGATKVTVTSATASGQEWQTSAGTGIEGGYKQGDKLLVAVWMKAADVEGGGPGKARLQVQLSAAPYTPLGQKMLSVTNSWQLHPFEVISDADHDKNSTTVTVHLGFAKQTIFLGPALVLNMSLNV